MTDTAAPSAEMPSSEAATQPIEIPPMLVYKDAWGDIGPTPELEAATRTAIVRACTNYGAFTPRPSFRGTVFMIATNAESERYEQLILDGIDVSGRDRYAILGIAVGCAELYATSGSNERAWDKVGEMIVDSRLTHRGRGAKRRR